MRYTVNLSPTPFRNRTPFWFGALAGLTVLALLGVSMASTWLNLRAENSGLETQVAVQTRRIEALKAHEPKPVEVKINAEHVATMEAARELVGRKTFSWSLLVSKIEPLIPHDVRVTNISVSARSNTPEQQKASDWEHHVARLTLEVVTKKYSDVTELITRMEKTGLFSVSPVQQNKIETGELLFTLSLEYRIPQEAPAIYVAQETGKGDGH